MKKNLSRRLFVVGLLAAGTFFPSLHANAEEGVTDSAILLGQTIGVTGQIAGPVKEMMAGAAAYFKPHQGALMPGGNAKRHPQVPFSVFSSQTGL